MIACPQCNAYMYPSNKLGVQIDSCSGCGGIWLDKGELSQLAGTKTDLPVAQVMPTATQYRCPHCGSGLAAEPYSPGDSVIVDICSGCQGVYLDRGELEKIQQLVKHVDAVFTPDKRDAMVNSARRSEALSAVYGTQQPASKQPVLDRRQFIVKVYRLLILTLAVTAIGSYFGIASGLGMVLYVPAVIANIVVFLITLWVRRKPRINMVALLTYTFLTGFTLSALLQAYIKAGMGDIIWQAVALTAGIFTALSAYVHVTKKDFSWMQGMLFIVLLGLVVSGFVMLFFPSSFGYFVYSCISAVIFSGYILYDTSRIILKYQTDEVVSAVIDLYLDIINLFIDLLRILSYLSRNDVI